MHSLDATSAVAAVFAATFALESSSHILTSQCPKKSIYGFVYLFSLHYLHQMESRLYGTTTTIPLGWRYRWSGRSDASSSATLQSGVRAGDPVQILVHPDGAADASTRGGRHHSTTPLHYVWLLVEKLFLLILFIVRDLSSSSNHSSLQWLWSLYLCCWVLLSDLFNLWVSMKISVVSPRALFFEQCMWKSISWICSILQDHESQIPGYGFT